MNNPRADEITVAARYGICRKPPSLLHAIHSLRPPSFPLHISVSHLKVSSVPDEKNTFTAAESVVIVVLLGEIRRQEGLYCTPALNSIIFSLLRRVKHRDLAFLNIGQSSEWIEREERRKGMRVINSAYISGILCNDYVPDRAAQVMGRAASVSFGQ